MIAGCVPGLFSSSQFNLFKLLLAFLPAVRFQPEDPLDRSRIPCRQMRHYPYARADSFLRAIAPLGRLMRMVKCKHPNEKNQK